MIIRKLKQKDLADACGMNRTYLSSILNGKRRCSLVVALKIEHHSGGAIKAKDLRPDLSALIRNHRKGQAEA